MFLSIATTHRPATDLGYLLMKHPDRAHKVEVGFGEAHVFFPQASPEICEAALVLDIDPIALTRGRGRGAGVVERYVNDRPYVASSFLAVALNRAFRTAMSGTCRDRPELADAEIPLEIRVTPLPGAPQFIAQLFEHLGWAVEINPVEAFGGARLHHELRLKGVKRLADALAHLYVLIPALDAQKHYWIDESEIEKLIEKGRDWLQNHPLREAIARNYLKNQRGLARAALARLAPETQDEALAVEQPPDAEQILEKPLRLHDIRLEAVAAEIAAAEAASVVDLGCGGGKLLQRLVKNRKLTRILGLDPSLRALEIANERLKLDEVGGAQRERVKLLHGALTYFDARWADVEAAALVEVIEHIDEDRLQLAAKILFGRARPQLVVVTTPNRDYNALFPGLAPGARRHADHRFEWTRDEFARWSGRIEEDYGYRARLSPIGPIDPTYGAPSQMAVFTR